MNCIAHTLVSLLFFGSLQAQESVDPIESEVELSIRAPQSKVLQVKSEPSGSARVRLLATDGSEIASASLSSMRPMWVARATVFPHRYIIGGTGFSGASGDRDGRLVHVEIPSHDDSVIVTQSSVVSNIWPVGGVLANGTLLFVDGKSRRILSTPYTYRELPDLSAASVVATESSITSLGRAGGLTASRLRVGIGQCVHYGCARWRGEQSLLSWSAGSWSCATALDSGVVNDSFTGSGFFGFEVLVPQGAQSLEVRDGVSGILLHSTTCQAGWSAIQPLPSLTQNPAVDVVVRFPGVPNSDLRISPTLRYGKPLSIAEVAIGNLHMARRLHLPADSWGVRADAMTTSGDQVFTGLLSMAVRNPDGTDPVVLNVGPGGQQAFLNAQIALPFSFRSGNIIDGIGSLAPPIANDPAADGVVVLGQIIVFGNNGEIGISDVSCSTLLSMAAATIDSMDNSQAEGSLTVGSNGSAPDLFGASQFSAQQDVAMGGSPAAVLFEAARQRFLGGN